MGAFQLAVLLGSKNGGLDAAQVMYWQKQLEDVISASECLPDLSLQMERISKSMAEIVGNEFVVLGTGPNYGTMKEGALKISELCWLFGAGEELEDFAHGRFREVDEKTPLMIISPTGSTYEKTMDLLAGCSTSKTPTIVVTDNKTKAMEKLATYVVEMPKIKDEYLTPFLYIFPFWFYGFYIRQLAGGLVGEVRHNLLAVDINFRAHFNELGEKI
jgi:glucosamine 6-phosphate synthetase-like amidotransferase/phosphosugar isomerase protein